MIQEEETPSTDMTEENLSADACVSDQLTEEQTQEGANSLRGLTDGELEQEFEDRELEDPGLCVYLTIEPNYESPETRKKLLEFNELIKSHWEIEALGLVEKIPRFSNE